MKELLNKNVTSEDLLQIIQQLESSEESIMKQAKSILSMTEGLYTIDFLIAAIINRSIDLNRGFLLLSNSNNYISAAPLIRLQLDNSLRFYAFMLVHDSDELYRHFMSGVPIRRMKDALGQRMTDAYLVQKLDDEVLPGIKNLYENTSDYVHLSNVHSYIQTASTNESERKVGIKIGFPDVFSFEKKVDFCYNMLVVTQLLADLIDAWKSHKIKMQSKK